MRNQWKVILEELDNINDQADEAIEASAAETSTSEDDSLDSELPDDSDDVSSPEGLDSENDDLDSVDLDKDSEKPDSDEDLDEIDDIKDYGANESDIDTNGTIDELDKLFTPTLIASNFTSEEDKKEMQESMSNANCLTEANMVKFDAETQASNLIQIASLLIARSKKSEKYDAFIKAYQLVKKLKGEIRREEEGAAKELARQYLQRKIDGDNEDASATAAKLLDLIK